MAASTRTWVSGAAGAAVLLVSAGWFALIAPQRADAETLAADAAAVEATNDVLAASVEQLRAAYVALPDRQAELAVLQQALPAELALSTLTRQVAAQADQSGVALMSLAPSTPGATEAGAAPAPETGEAAAAGTDGTATAPAPAPAADPAAAAAPTGPVVPTPVEIRVIGSLANAQLFVQALQTGARDLLVTDLALTAEQPADAGAGRPETVNGDVTLTVIALAFVLPDTAAAQATAPSNGDSR